LDFIYLKHVESLALDLNSISLKDLIFWPNWLDVNHKSKFSQLIVTMHHTKVLKTLTFLRACWYLKVHDSHSSAFMFHIFIQQLHF
jgi:hypothetical protein